MIHSTSHARIRPTRTIGTGGDRRTIRVTPPARGNDRRRAITEQTSVLR
jgi:hypothetical protein